LNYIDGWVAKWAQQLTEKIVELEKTDGSIPDDQKTVRHNGYYYSGDRTDRKQMFGIN
jgi:hypothetical protein